MLDLERCLEEKLGLKVQALPQPQGPFKRALMGLNSGNLGGYWRVVGGSRYDLGFRVSGLRCRIQLAIYLLDLRDPWHLWWFGLPSTSNWSLFLRHNLDPFRAK